MKNDNDRIQMRRIAAYLRKSRADSAAESAEEVLARHEAITQDYFRREYGAELPEAQILREVASGETIADRPVMQALIRRIQDGDIRGLFVVELQRISRGDLADTGELSRLFRITGCRILTPGRVYDVADEYDRRFFEAELMRGNDYLEYIKRILARGRKRAVEEGEHLSVPPYGYRRKITDDKKSTLETEPKEAAVVRWVYEWYAAGVQRAEIVDRLRALGEDVTCKAEWTRDFIARLIKNPVYAGMVRYGFRQSVQEYRDGRLVCRMKQSDVPTISPGMHEAIIPPELWQRCQEVRAAHTPRRHINTEIASPLAGILKCAKCGHAMARSGQVYICRHSSPCDCRGCPAPVLERRILQALKQCLYDVEGSEPKPSPITAEIKNAAERAIEEAKRQRGRLYDFLERGIYSEELYAERMAELTARETKARQELERAEAQERVHEATEKQRGTLYQCIDSMQSGEATPGQINQLLRLLVDRIEYSREPLAVDPDAEIMLHIVFRVPELYKGRIDPLDE